MKCSQKNLFWTESKSERWKKLIPCLETSALMYKHSTSTTNKRIQYYETTENNKKQS